MLERLLLIGLWLGGLGMLLIALGKILLEMGPFVLLSLLAGYLIVVFASMVTFNYLANPEPGPRRRR